MSTGVLGYDAQTHQQLTTPDEVAQLFEPVTVSPWDEPALVKASSHEFEANVIIQELKTEVGALQQENYLKDGLYTQSLLLVLHLCRLAGYRCGYLNISNQEVKSIVLQVPTGNLFLPLPHQWFVALQDSFPLQCFGTAFEEQGLHNMHLIEQLANVNQTQCDQGILAPLEQAIKLLLESSSPQVPVSVQDSIEAIHSRAAARTIDMVYRAIDLLNEVRNGTLTKVVSRQ